MIRFDDQAPGELGPEQVVPGRVYLASSACEEAGIVLRAQDGQFATGAFETGPGASFGSTDCTPEAIASRWAQFALPGDS